MKGHTPEPWATEYREDRKGMFSQDIFDAKGETIATCAWYKVKVDARTTTTNREANARRIVACVNACEGIDDEVLEGARRGIDVFKRQIAELESERDQYKRLSDALIETINDPEGRLATLQKQRDELLAALESISTIPNELASEGKHRFDALAVIARIKEAHHA